MLGLVEVWGGNLLGQGCQRPVWPDRPGSAQGMGCHITHA